MTNPNFFVVASTENPYVFPYTLRPLGFSTPRTSDLSKAYHLVDFVYNLGFPSKPGEALPRKIELINEVNHVGLFAVYQWSSKGGLEGYNEKN